MKATGIVRRIDDLGRVVVPKEIRRTLRIREGDPLEIFTEQNGAIVLKKYSPIGELSTFAAQYATSMAEAAGSLVCVMDRDHIIAAEGTEKRIMMENRSAQRWSSLLNPEAVRWRMHRRKIARN